MTKHFFKTSVNLPFELGVEANTICEEMGLARSAFVSMAVRDFVSRWKRERLEMLELEEKLKKIAA